MTLISVWRDCTRIRVGLVSLLGIAVLAAGCHSQKGAKPPEASGGETRNQVSAEDDCVVPTTDALARFDGISESDISLRHDIDFNGDGQTDAIVRVQAGSDPTHLLYIRKRGCIRAIGQITAFKVGCEEDPDANGYCILWVEKFVNHGDRRRSTMSFVGGSYKPTAESELIPGSRDRPE